ncbi:MAG: DUF748 domain-containing protein [Fluviibacter phosphoraccumulans]
MKTSVGMMKKTLKVLISLVLLVILAFWGLGTLILPGVIRDQAQAFGDQIGYRIEMGEIELTPRLLRARVNDIRLTPASASDKATLFALKQIEVDARFWPLLLGQVSLERIVLDAPEVLLARNAGAGRERGDWNWVSLIDRINRLSASEPKQDPEQHSSLKVSVDALVLNGGRLAVRDGRQAYDLGPFNLQLTELRNQDDTGHVGGSSLASTYTLNLGSVTIPLPKVDGVPDRQLAFAKVSASGHMMGDASASLKAALNLTLDDGTIQSVWQVAANGTLTGKVAVEGLAVKPWLNLAPSYERLDSPSGTINGDFELKQDADAFVLDGNLKLDKLDVRVSSEKEPLLAWSTMAISRLHIALPPAESKPGALSIHEVLVDNPKIRFVLDAQRQSNFRSLFSQPEPKTAPKALPSVPVDGQHELVAKAPSTMTTASSTNKPSVRQQAPGFRYDIRSIRLKNGYMFFADESIKPMFRVDVTDLNGAMQGISNEPGRYATLVLNGRAAKTGSLRARGQLAFADPRQNNDVSLVFRNIPLNATNPYTMTFAGYQIDDGRIDVDLRYVTKNGELQGKNRFVIKKIKLGEPVPDYQGTRLPLGLAIALLEDSDGMIDVNIPVKGNVNEPEFSVGHLVWQAVKTVLANIVTAPFRALGALMGIENMDAIAFVPGESALPLEGDEQLLKIADYLAKRPKAKLVIHGTYDSAVDSTELARAMADTAILEAAGLKVSPGEPLPTPNLTDPKVKAGLKSAYGAQVGRIKLGQRLLTLPDNPERDTQLRQELMQSYKITDEQLMQLAAQRAEAVKARLLSVDAKLAERITIGDAEAVSADSAGVPLRVTLETGS